ncbi:MAG: GNAT family N-acetyltransferase [Microgenomates group bacterium]
MFIPGKIIKKFSSKRKREIIIRYPKWEDLDEATKYINNLSKEDTFITFSGEKIKKSEEAKTFSDWFFQMEMGDKVVLATFDKEKLIGLTNVDRVNNRKRSLHVGVFGISVEKNYRGEGIGFILAKTVIEEAKEKIRGLKMIVLNVFSPNYKALNLYKKLGFIEYGRLRNGLLYKNNFIDEVKMVLYL